MGFLQKIDGIQTDGVISFEEFYAVIKLHASDGQDLRDVEDLKRAMKGVKEEIDSEGRERAAAQARKRRKQEHDYAQGKLIERMSEEAKRVAAQAEKDAARQRGRRQRGRGRGRMGRGGPGRGRAGSVAFEKIRLPADAVVHYVASDVDGGQEDQTVVQELGGLIRAGRVAPETEVWLEGMSEWLPLAEAAKTVGGLSRLLEEGMRCVTRDFNSGHQLPSPPANWCPMFASPATQGAGG